MGWCVITALVVVVDTFYRLTKVVENCNFGNFQGFLLFFRIFFCSSKTGFLSWYDYAESHL